MGHEHHDKSIYYLEQLCTIATCAALGIVMILLWHYQVLAMFLDPKFHDPVLWGGIALLVLVAIRTIAVWASTRREAAVAECCHHGEECQDHGHNHDHAHESAPIHDDIAQANTAAEHSTAVAHVHTHDCGHDHGWAPWRYAVLILPVVLFLMRIPWPDPPEPPEAANVVSIRLNDAAQAADLEASRTHWEDRMKKESVSLKGKLENLWPGQDLQVGGHLRQPDGLAAYRCAPAGAHLEEFPSLPGCSRS
jgi:hypothetical protein